jgi:xanthine dehydrogenase accessory factor
MTKLWIIGAGPVGRRLAHLAAELEFDVTVLDERASLLEAEHFPTGVELRSGEFDVVLPALATRPDDFVAIVSQVWQRDARALELLVERPLAYLGLIGCRRKIGEIFPPLEAAGVSAAALARVQAPIGIAIGSKTAAEIAVSIAAQLIATRRQLRS